MTHTLSVLVENRPGALARVSNMFARRGFNIESLAVGPTERPNVSRITLRVDCAQESIEQIEKQMHKLVNVLRVNELEPGEAIERELALLKVNAPADRRGELLALAEVFSARVADLGPNAIIFEVVGSPEELDSFEELVRPHGLKELARTGRIGLARASTARAPTRQHVLRSRKEVMAATVYREGNLDLLNGKVAVIGYGSQGHAHALNLRDSGVEVEVGLRLGSDLWAAAEEARLTVKAIPAAVQGAQLVAILLPDHVQKGVFEREIEPNLEPGAAVLFAHGFNVHFGQIKPGAGHDVIMVAPKGPGHRVRQLFEAGAGTPGLVAVAQDESGNAFDLALAYGTAIGCGRAGMLATTFAEETESDLFGEQAVLCGGVCALMQAGFETLVDAGYQPEIAYYECINEMKLIVDLIYEGGFSYMRHSISDVAEYGDLTRGEVIVDQHVKTTMKKLLEDIRNGSFARELIAEEDAGRPRLTALRRSAAQHPVEQVGQELRDLAGREGLLGAEAHGVR